MRHHIYLTSHYLEKEYVETIIAVMTKNRARVAVAIALTFGLTVSSFGVSLAAKVPNKTLKASTLVSISYPSLFKLPKSGCAKIPVRYQVGKLELDESYFTVVITDDEDRTVGEATWYGASAEASTKAMPKSGTLQLKVCRDAWFDSIEEVDYAPTYRGTYDIYLSATGSRSADASASMKFSE
jgi:hypothetical protein